MRIEGLAASVRGKESPFRQSNTHRGREHQCHPASQRNARLAGPQTLAREVQSYQRGRACCINRHTGAAQVQHVRQAVGENAVGCSSPGICVDRIEHAILLKRIVIVIAGYKHADPLACQTRPYQAGIVECFVRDFQEQALLRVEVSGLPRRNSEERRIEAVNRGDEAPPSRGDHAASGRIGVIEPLPVPAIGGHLADRVAPVAQCSPKLVSRLSERKTAPQSNDRHGLGAQQRQFRTLLTCLPR